MRVEVSLTSMLRSGEALAKDLMSFWPEILGLGI